LQNVAFFRSLISRADCESTNIRALAAYSIFDSALYRNLRLKWHFHQEKATLHDLTMATCESKML